jgi:thiamine biosynthesis protein ThiI
MTAPAGQSHLYLVRIASELATKARGTRRRFTERLVANLRDALRINGIGARVTSRWSRILVEADAPGAERTIASVFGVSSVSEVDARFAADLAEIVRRGEAVYAERVRGRKFGVETRVVGKYPFTSHDIKVELGAALNQYAGVDLDHPDVTVTVEVRDGDAFLYAHRLRAVGGLPLGVEGRAVCLLSGGFDSAVAAWLMLKRGVALDYVFLNLAGDAYERAVVSVAKVLADAWSYGDRPRIHVVDFAGALDAIKRGVQPKYWQIVLKRLMYRAAEAVAREIGADAIVTGESVGQVSSQTLGNLRAIDAVATLPVLRPLVGWDKEEIIQRAVRIGTAVLSQHVREYCAIATDKPVTHARPEAAAGEESRVDLVVVSRAVGARKTLDLRSLTAADLVAPYLFTDVIPEGAAVLDCREPYHYRAWHYPGAEQRDLDELARQFGRLDKGKTYVLYCAFGVQSAYVTEAMQRAGYEVYAFKGGIREVMRYAERVRTGKGNGGTVEERI